MLFLSCNVLRLISLDQKMLYATLLIVSVILILKNNSKLTSAPFIYLVGFVTLYSVFKLYTDRGEGTRVAVMNVIGPMLLYAAIPSIRYTTQRMLLWRWIYKIIILLFIVNSLLAIFERMSGSLVFGWGYAEDVANFTTEGISEFRSTALLSHPLLNALITSTLMSFFLISPYKITIKLGLWSLGYFAILCFNTRAAIVGNALLFISYFLYICLYDKKITVKQKRLFMGIGAIFAITATYLLQTGLIGGRLMENGLFDDTSAQVRVDIWSIFDYYRLTDFMLGVDMSTYDEMMFTANLIATENFWLDWLFKFGFAFLIPFVLLYGIFLKNRYSDYNSFETLFTIGTFVLLASVNNSLSTSILPVFILLLSIDAFSPRYVTMIAHPSFIDIENLRCYK